MYEKHEIIIKRIKNNLDILQKSNDSLLDDLVYEKKKNSWFDNLIRQLEKDWIVNFEEIDDWKTVKRWFRYKGDFYNIF